MFRRTTFHCMPRIALCSLVLALGCVDENPSLIVTGVLIPEQEDGVCVFSCNTTSGDIVRGSGVYDPVLDSGTGYSAGICIANFRVNNATGGSGFAADTGRVLFQRANIQIFGINGEDFGFDFSVPLTNSVPSAADVTTPGNAALVVNLIPPSVGAQLRDALPIIQSGTDSSTVLVSFTVEGETTGGINVESTPSTFPVTIAPAGLACQASLIPDDFVGPCAPGVDSASAVPSGSALADQLEAIRGAPLPFCPGGA